MVRRGWCNWGQGGNVTFRYERLCPFCCWGGIPSTHFFITSYFGNITMAKVCISSDIINPFSSEGSVAEESETCGETSAGGWCGQSVIIVFGVWRTDPLHGNGEGRPKADWGSAERGVHWWCVYSVQESDHD